MVILDLMVTYLFLSFNSDSINTFLFFLKHKSLPKDLSVWESVSFLSGYFLASCCEPALSSRGPAKLKIVRVRSVPNDVSVSFASCLPNWRHSKYYSCQTELAELQPFQLLSCRPRASSQSVMHLKSHDHFPATQPAGRQDLNSPTPGCNENVFPA